jgi:hypothetical protein
LKDKVFIVLLDFKDGQREVDSEGTLHALERTEMKERDHLEDKSVDEKITLTWIFKKS